MSGDGPPSLDRIAHYRAVVRAWQAQRRLPTVVAAVLGTGGEPVWTGAAGEGADPRTQYRLGSLTKVLTALLVLGCRDDGVLGLDDPLGASVPGTPFGAVTLRQLLSHTGGLPSEPRGSWWERSDGVDLPTLLSANADAAPVLAPGEEFHYSNLGYALLGEVVARVRGRSWAEEVRDRLLEPLEMTRTGYLPTAPAAAGRSVHHLRGTLTAEPATDTRAMAPAGQLWGTLDDLARLLRHVAGVPEMHAAQPPAPAYGLGVQRIPCGSRTLVGHTGSMPGFQASAFVDPDTGEGVVALTNATTGFGPGLVVDLLAPTTPVPGEPWVPTVRVPDWAADLLGYWHWGHSAYEARWHNERLELLDLARGRVVAERFERRDGRIVGTFGYHRAETLHVVRDGERINHLECATFVYTREPYDPRAPIPGGVPDRSDG